MTRSLPRLPWAEIAAVLGVVFGAWLIHNTFNATADTPNFVLFIVGALDILLCFGLLGFMLRGRLREGPAGGGLPRSWIVVGAVLIACFLGWIGGLLLDSDRLLKEQAFHKHYLEQLSSLEDSLHHWNAVVPADGFTVNHKVWLDNHVNYLRVHDQLRTALRGNPGWDKDLARIDADVEKMNTLINVLLAEKALDKWLTTRGEFTRSRKDAIEQAMTLRAEITQAERGFADTNRARWHAIGAAALTGVVVLLGCLLFWLVFDRELRRSWKLQGRLAADEARFRWLIEKQSEPIAVLDPAGNLLYVNPAWQTAFHYELDELNGANLFELVHPDDRVRVRTALAANDMHHAVSCRLSADYGVWHDVELQCQSHNDSGASVVRIRDVRETPDVPMMPQPELLNDEKLRTAETKLAELEKECAELRERESHARGELEHQQWLLGSHTQANSEGVLILSARGEPLSWNPAFVRLWKLSDDTMAAHSWQTIAAHMESQVEAGWDDFQRAVGHKGPNSDTWEMTLEGDRTLEVCTQTLHDHPAREGAVQFQFRDVTSHKNLETQVRDHHAKTRDWQKRIEDHEEQKETYEASVREHEKRLKQLEKQLRERDERHDEMQGTLRDHQDRLHQLHETHESHEAELKAAREASRRLASGVANDLNNVLSVVLGNTDVLRDNLPRDHVAQNYLDDIHNAASRGTELTQKLLAYSRNHLLQMVPLEMNHQLGELEAKIRTALGPVQLQWQRGNDELWVKTDPHPLEQALLHLVTHARSHMPNGGTLTIAANHVQLSRSDLTHVDMKPGAYIQVSLRDTGAGIADETLPHVFEPYHAVVDGQKGDLALATAYGILRQSGGCIAVASEKGKGTEWTILLPETAERPQHGAQPMRASA